MRKRILVIVILWCSASVLHAARGPLPPVVDRVFRYAATVDTTMRPTESTYTYRRMTFSVDRRNPFLMLVPTAYAIAHGRQRRYVSETYARMDYQPSGGYEEHTLLHTTTVPHRRQALSPLSQYLTPRIYDETIFGESMLSPFHSANSQWYRYKATALADGRASITFKPRRKNTQLVTGNALVDEATGRIISCQITGEYDMVTFRLRVTMGDDGLSTLYARRCEVLTRFRFVRSKTTTRLLVLYGLPQVITDSITDKGDMQLMARVRPYALEAEEQGLYDDWQRRRQQRDTIAQADTTHHHAMTAKEILWDVVGDNLVNRIKTRFGENNQGYLRINPILNPLYMGYDHRRGFTYKFDVRASYQLGDNSEVSARLKSGYAFKQRQFYFRLPMFIYFNKRKNNYLKLEWGNGNHIRSKSVRRGMMEQYQLPEELGESTYDYLNEFRRGDVRLIFNWNFNSRVGFQLGTLYQYHDAVHSKAYRDLGWQTHYRSFAPVVQLQWRPRGWDGPVFTADYDRSIKGLLKSNTGYERIELDGSYIHRIRRLKAVQMRAGVGFYTWKDRKAYFLNYENFREDNLPGGWNDDWSGDFELLRSDNYNYSSYYVRANISYESPLLLLSWLPLVGRYMEMERIYLSVLDAEKLHPYVEMGYAFTNRIFSCGIFVSNGKGNRSVGCKIGLELFRHW